jgi:hypothetical protein
MLPAGTAEAPEVRPHDERYRVEVTQADGPNGEAIPNVYDKKDPGRSLRYTARFHTKES